MLLRVKRKHWLSIGLLVFALAFPVSRVLGIRGGRVAISRVATSAETFPQVDLWVTVLDSKGVPVSALSQNDFQVLENQQPVVLTGLKETERGVRVSLVLDMGKWINNRALGQELVKDSMRNLALSFVGAMRGSDETEIVVVYGKNAQVVQPFTSDKKRLGDAIYNLAWDNQQVSYGLEGLKQAAKDLIATDDQKPRLVLFLSAGIMSRNSASTDEDRVAQQMLTQHVPAFVVYFPWKGHDEGFVYRLKWFPQQTEGRFMRWQVEGDEDTVLKTIDRYRPQYHLTYRSPDGRANQRRVVVAYGGLYGDASYAVEPAWVKPGRVSIVVNEGKPVERKAETPFDDVHDIPMTSAPVKITVSGLGGRRLKEEHFFINGAEVPVTEVGPSTFTAVWDLRDMIEEGEHPALLEFVAKDELGITSQGKTTVAVDVVPPLTLNSICSAVAKVPGVGASGGKTCMKLGVNWMTTGLLLAVVALAGVLWRKRERVAEVGRDLGVRATHVLRRLTNRLQRMEPKARLEVVRGLPPEARKTLQIFGETKIGRSHEHANLVLENDNVSRLHCIVHEEMNGGWSIEDQDSANGTFVNGKQIPPFKPVPLQEGARIELGPVEYGGVEMLFHVVEQPLDRLFAEDDEDLFPQEPLEPAATVEIPSMEEGGSGWVDLRETARVDSDDFPFDPNDEANLRY